MFGGALIGYVIVAAIAFVIGIFVYRNNQKQADPYAEKIDALWDKMEARIKELQNKIEEKDV